MECVVYRWSCRDGPRDPKSASHHRQRSRQWATKWVRTSYTLFSLFVPLLFYRSDKISCLFLIHIYCDGWLWFNVFHVRIYNSTTLWQPHTKLLKRSVSVILGCVYFCIYAKAVSEGGYTWQTLKRRSQAWWSFTSLRPWCHTFCIYVSDERVPCSHKDEVEF